MSTWEANMSFGIQPRGKNYVNILLNHEKLEDIKKYGSFRGPIASIFGTAEKIQDDNGKSYYVKVSSLGKAWKKVHPEGVPNKAGEIAAKIDQHIKEMSDKKIGFMVINKINEGRRKIDESVKEILNAIKESEPKYSDENCDMIFYFATSVKDPNSLNMEELKTKLQVFDKQYMSHIKAYETLFPENITDHGMKDVFDSIRKQFSPSFF